MEVVARFEELEASARRAETAVGVLARALPGAGVDIDARRDGGETVEDVAAVELLERRRTRPD